MENLTNYDDHNDHDDENLAVAGDIHPFALLYSNWPWTINMAITQYGNNFAMQIIPELKLSPENMAIDN